MLITSRKSATTTTATRRAIQESTGSDYEVATEYLVSRDTVCKWRASDSVVDGSHTPHRLQALLNADQEELVIYLRQQMRLLLDDLLAVDRHIIHPDMCRSALARLLRRQVESHLPEPAKPVPETKHRATRWVFISIAKARTPAAARQLLKALADRVPFKIRTVLTDNGTEFTDLLFGSLAK